MQTVQHLCDLAVTKLNNHLLTGLYLVHGHCWLHIDGKASGATAGHDFLAGAVFTLRPSVRVLPRVQVRGSTRPQPRTVPEAGAVLTMRPSTKRTHQGQAQSPHARLKPLLTKNVLTWHVEVIKAYTYTITPPPPHTHWQTVSTRGTFN